VLWTGEDPRRSTWARYGWMAPLALWLAAATSAGVLEAAGWVWILLWGLAVWGATHPSQSKAARLAATVAVVVLAGALMSHLLPGFNNVRVWSRVVLSDDGLPFTLHLNADKPLVGLFLLGWGHARLHRPADWAAMARAAAPVGVATIALLLLLSLLAGYVRPDLKLPSSTPLWLGVNLLFTCAAEEAFFRGFIQRRLVDAWRPRRGGTAAAVAVAAGLFGLAHVGGGWVYVGLAAVAGVGYGWAYERTGRIEASILTHFALNTVHFIGFTYPALAR